MTFATCWVGTTLASYSFKNKKPFFCLFSRKSPRDDRDVRPVPALLPGPEEPRRRLPELLRDAGGPAQKLLQVRRLAPRVHSHEGDGRGGEGKAGGET
jgi:hypothetical protein